MITADGLTEYEQATVARLGQVLEQKAERNRLRSLYMDAKHLVRRVPPTAPPYLRRLAVVLGWPAKAVELLARRVRLEDFSLPSGELSQWGLDEILRDNNYFAESAQGRLASLVNSTSFEVVTAGAEGEPAALISRVTAMDGTGDYNPRTRRLDNFLWVHERDGERVTGFTLFYERQAVTVEANKVVNRQATIVDVPVAQLPYKPRIDRPFGQSRISRPVMTLTDSAVRTIIRSEGTADFYGAPWFMIFGPGEDAFSKNSWQMIMDRVNAIPDNEDAANPRAEVKQFAQADQRPHVEQLQVWAGLFAGETNIPVSSLGVGLSQANPTSSESYLASREDLIAEAEDAADAWSGAHRQVALWAWQIAEGEREVPADLAGLQPVWRDPRHVSRSAAADATLKTVQAFPWMGDSDAVVETLGFDRRMTERLLADKKRAQGGSLLERLAAMPQGAGGAPAGVSELERAQVLRTKLEALGVGARAGATFDSVRQLLGLDVEFSGSTPVTLRAPEGDDSGD